MIFSIDLVREGQRRPEKSCMRIVYIEALHVV